ncbi:TonB-dependent receptor domain-containing protein [Parvularcula oceani]|uniref:TonB-dependent receptor domain-containing protein n=1 Tax=Parvularcula oceani TaxID=1247963 RepID=UPI0004E1F9EF|nr:TonB-dependent receptor [Parvularcula oceani]
MSSFRLCTSLLVIAALMPAHAQEAEEKAPATAVDLGTEEDEIVVTASGFKRNPATAPASVTLLSRIELEQRRVINLGEALETVQGVDTGSGTGKTGGPSIAIRGMPSDYTLVLIDGRRQNPAGNVTPNGFGGTSTSFLPPVSAIERIEVVRGPMSTLYGSDAMGGVVNMITREPGEALSGEIGLDATLQEDAEFGNTYTGNAYVDGPIVPGRLFFALKGQATRREAATLTFVDDEGQEQEVSRRGSSPVEADLYAYGGRVTWTPGSSHRLWVDYEGAYQSYDNSEGQLGTLGPRGYAEELTFERDQLLLAHRWEVAGGVLDWDVTWNETETTGRILPADVPGTDRIRGGDRELRATNLLLNGQYNIEIDAHQLTLGGQVWDAELIDGVAADPLEHVQTALFAEDAWAILPALTLTGGVRWDHHDTFGSQVSPRVYAVYEATPNLVVKGGISRGFKTPRLDQIAEGIVGFRGQGTIPVLGTPTLQPETTTTYEASFFYDIGTFSLTAGVFRNEFDDKIAGGPALLNCSFELTEAEYDALADRSGCTDVGFYPGVAEFAQTVNVDEAVTEGVEAAATWDVTGSLRLTANYTLTDSEQLSGPEEGEPLVNTPRHVVNGRIAYDITPDIGIWTRARFNSDRYRGSGEAQDQLGDYDAFSIFDLGASWQATDKVRFNATINNVTDENFVDFLPYTRRGSPDFAPVYPIIREGRNLWLSANFAF